MAKKAFLKATRLNPFDSKAFFSLASEMARIEQLSPFIFNNKNHTQQDTLLYFQKAILLRPNSIYDHYALARYLNEQNNKALLMQTNQNMSRIYPPTYYKIKKEPYWSSEASKAFQKGLNQAIEEKISLRNTHMVMSALLAGDKNWPAAINHYKAALIRQPDDNGAGNYLHLGRLYLENGQMKEAEEIFLKGITMSRNREDDLEDLYWRYKKKGYPEEIEHLFKRVRNRIGIFPQIDILLSRVFMDQKKYRPAENLLTALIEKNPSAEAYYLLARIAESEKNWDNMELAIQKATVLEPENSWYHFKFSEVLKRFKKLDRAEKEAGMAIRNSRKPRAWMFNHRGWIRWSNKDYPGAVKDWKEAALLKPKKAYYYAQIAEGYHKMGQWEPAIAYYQKAINLDPKNKNYQKKYHSLKEEQNAVQP